MNPQYSKSSDQTSLEVVSILLNSSKKSFLAAIAVAIALLFLVRNSVETSSAYLWLSVVITAYANRSYIAYLFNQDPHKQQNLTSWLNYFRISSALCGVAWGLSTYFIFPTHYSELQAFLFLALAGVCASGVIILSIDTIAATLYSTSLFLAASPVLYSANHVSIIFLVLLAVFVIYIGIAGKQLAKGLVESINLRFNAENNQKEISLLTQRQSLHLEHTPMGVIEWDEQLNVSAWNKACVDIFGYANTEVMGKHISFFLPNLTNLTHQEILDSLSQEQNSLKKLVNHADKIIHCEWLNTLLKNQQGEFVGLASLVQDKTEFIATQEKVHQLAYFDTLTNLPNRGLLIDRINQSVAINKRTKTYGMLAFIDLDHFKAINDIKGHDAGDHLLKVIAGRLQNNLRKQDTAARLGGDEFVLVLSDIGKTKKQAEVFSKRIIEKIMRAIKVPVQYDGYQHQPSASVGVCLFNDEGLEADELLRRADISMYLSKKQGRNCYQYFDDSLQPKYEYQLKLKHDLNHALENNQLQIYLQGQYNCYSDLIGAEVLLRWQHPELGMVMPNDFIPLAEESGLIVPIGFCVLKKSCTLLKQWQSNQVSEHITLSVNVSAIQFNHPDFIQHVEKAIKQSGCDATKLCLELTESTVVNSFENLTDKMNQIRAMGVMLAIDDFGTGYSSLSVLKDLPLNELKIDRSFVKDFTNNPVDLTIVQTILQMGKNLNLRVVAEGVETESQLACLSNYGCNMFQGYFFAKPCSQADFEARMHKIAIQKPLSRLPSPATNNHISSFAA